ncbi:hypothetical protein M758_4G228000 [Ceratodon purpureus]|nr:hypothetical protein M758_4G228000 [Ceratodon purpureus]
MNFGSCPPCPDFEATVPHCMGLLIGDFGSDKKSFFRGPDTESRSISFQYFRARDLSTGSGGVMAGRIALFDVHCHLQDSRILHKVPELIRAAREKGVQWMAVNGTSEEDWHVVKKMGEEHASVIPCYGLHPWYVNERSKDWLSKLKSMLESEPAAAVGEVGLCQSKKGREVEVDVQVEVLRQQLHLARELHRPVAVHCVRAFGPLLQLLEEMGHFPEGLILHSFMGNQEQVKQLAKYNAYFSFSGFATSLKRQKAKGVWRAVPLDRLLLETDCPDALPSLELSSLAWVSGDPDAPSQSKCCEDEDAKPSSEPGAGALNQPANVRALLTYVASLLELSEEDLAEKTFRNSESLFSYPGTKLKL